MRRRSVPAPAYFFACHWEANHDAAKQRAYLDKGLEADPEDVDVLIACYRLPGQSAAFHAKIADLIKKAAATLHDQIRRTPITLRPATSTPG